MLSDMLSKALASENEADFKFVSDVFAKVGDALAAQARPAPRPQPRSPVKASVSVVATVPTTPIADLMRSTQEAKSCSESRQAMKLLAEANTVESWIESAQLCKVSVQRMIDAREIEDVHFQR
jgi:hypothetical protein